MGEILQLLEEGRLRAEQCRVRASVDKENEKALMYSAELYDRLCDCIRELLTENK